jgi:hypothetical protein
MARIVLLLLALVAACSRAPARDPAVVSDVLEYVEHIKQWEGVESRVLNALREVRHSQFVDDDYVIATLGEVMDDIQLHIEAIGHYRPKTAAVGDVHARYRQAWDDLRASFQQTIQCMERKDYMELSRAVEAMQRARSDLVTVAAALNLLLKDTGLKEPESGVASS